MFRSQSYWVGHFCTLLVQVGNKTLSFKVGKHSINFAQTQKKRDAMWPVTCNAVSDDKSYVVISDIPALVPVPISVVTPPPQIGSNMEEEFSVLDIAGNGLGKVEPLIAPTVKEPIIQRGGLGCLSYGTDEDSDEDPKKKEPVKISKYDLEFDEPCDVTAWEVAIADDDPLSIPDVRFEWSSLEEMSAVEGTSYSQEPSSGLYHGLKDRLTEVSEAERQLKQSID